MELEETDCTFTIHAEAEIFTPCGEDYQPVKVSARDEEGRATEYAVTPGVEDGDDLNLCRSCTDQFIAEHPHAQLSVNDPEIWVEEINASEGGAEEAWKSSGTASGDGTVVYLACDGCGDPLITISHAEV